MKCTGLKISEEIANEIYKMRAGTRDAYGVPLWSADEIIRKIKEEHGVEITPAHIWFYGDVSYKDALKMIRSFGLEVKKVLKDNFAEHLINYFMLSGKKKISLEKICAHFSDEWLIGFKPNTMKYYVSQASEKYPGLFTMRGNAVKFNREYVESYFPEKALEL